jgi:putative tricarboxylic transport membrane protein
MDFLNNLILGWQVAASVTNLFYCFIGVLLGTIVGVLPGLGPTATIALLLPLTYGMDLMGSLIMLSGVYYGAMYGGSITSILLRVPGEAASVVTCFDGYPMAQRGRAGVALGISAFGSFIAGTIGVFGLSLLAPSLSSFASRIGSPEYVLLMYLGLTLVTQLSDGSKIKAIMMAAIGLILGCVGMDPVSANPRFTFGIDGLLQGIDLPILAIGLFGISEILFSAGQKEGPTELIKTSMKLSNLLPDLEDWKKSIGSILRGTLVGFFWGIIPAGGTALASFVSYSIERKMAKNPEEFGKGDIRGVAGPESANNSGTASAFVPLLTLGIPTTAVMALLIGAFMIHGVTPGPLIIQNHPEIFWGIVVSMYIGNIFLIILNVPLIGLFVQILKVPQAMMGQLVIIVCFFGSFTINNNPFDMLVVAILGIIGYIMRKLDYDPAPLVLAYVVGPMMEKSLRTSLLISQGDLSIFITRPISRVLVIFTLLFILLSITWNIMSKRKKMSIASISTSCILRF